METADQTAPADQAGASQIQPGDWYAAPDVDQPLGIETFKRLGWSIIGLAVVATVIAIGALA